MKKTTKRIALDAALTALALALFVLETQIPPPVALPGVKLGLSNIVVLTAIYALGRRDAAAILLLRVVLGGVFSGSVIALLFSAAGSAFAFAVMCLLSRVMGARRVWAVSVFGALAHNAGQLVAAALTLGTARVLWYAPALVLSGIATGVFTGLCAQYVVRRNIFRKFIS